MQTVVIRQCDMGKYSTRPMSKLWAFSLDMCCIFPYRTNKMNVFIFSHKSQITYKLPDTLQFKIQLECDMGW